MTHIITDNDIRAVPNLGLKFLSADENEIITKYIKLVLSRAGLENNSNEVGLLIDSFDYSNLVWYRGTETGIRTGQWLRNFNGDQEHMGRYIFIHNHPNNSGFSFRDIRSLLITDAIFLVIAVQNNGSLHVLCKTRPSNLEMVAWIRQHFSTPSEFCRSNCIEYVHYVYRRRLNYD
jgi:hypothetical protein